MLNIKILLCLLLKFTILNAITHLILKDGMIRPQKYSTFNLKHPNDLVGFLNQNKCGNVIDNIFEESTEIQKNLSLKMNHVDKFSKEFLENFQSKCELTYFLKVEDLLSTIQTEKYKNRIKLIINELLSNDIVNNNMINNINSNNNIKNVPNCDEYLSVNYSMFTFEHLKGMKNRRNLTMEPEVELNIVDLGISDISFPRKLSVALRKNPNSWQLHTLSSYYWRYKGKSTKAIDCARLGVYLAPRNYKDIPLLSLGTIFQRSASHIDAVIVLNAAVDHGMQYAENHFAFANSLFMLSEFEEAFQYYDTALILDKSFFTKIDFIRKSLTCFKYVKKRLISIEDILVEMLSEIGNLAKRKNLFDECFQRLSKIQGSSKFVINEYMSGINKENLLKHCKAINPETGECNYFDDVLFLMELEDATNDLVYNYIEITNELIQEHLETSMGVFKDLNIDKAYELHGLNDVI